MRTNIGTLYVIEELGNRIFHLPPPWLVILILIQIDSKSMGLADNEKFLGFLGILTLSPNYFILRSRYRHSETNGNHVF